MPHLGHAAERRALAQQCGKLRLGQHLLPVAPRIIGDEAADMVEQVAHADARAVRRGIGPAAQFGNIAFRRIVEPQLAIIAQFEDGERGERLGHGGDAEQCVGGDRAARRQFLHPLCPDQLQPVGGDDAIGKAGDIVFGHEGGEQRVGLGLDGRDVGRGLGGGGLGSSHSNCRNCQHVSPHHDSPIGHAPHSAEKPSC
jgi:hypothetical protein